MALMFYLSIKNLTPACKAQSLFLPKNQAKLVHQVQSYKGCRVVLTPNFQAVSKLKLKKNRTKFKKKR